MNRSTGAFRCPLFSALIVMPPTSPFNRAMTHGMSLPEMSSPLILFPFIPSLNNVSWYGLFGEMLPMKNLPDGFLFKEILILSVAFCLFATAVIVVLPVVGVTNVGID